ncbi:MAG: aminotransferase class V-fold PLP-dependent enzyme [Caldilineaceae bacterium]
MLIAKDEFIGLENVAHLCAGGETPMLKSHRDAVERFFQDKVLGEVGRLRFEETAQRARQQVAQLFGVASDEIAFLSSTSDGVNLLAHALEWQPGDNVVICDVEFPSDVLPWTRLERAGVEIRVVRQCDWYVALDDIEAAIDARTRVVAVSHVSYFTGQRLDLAALSARVHAKGALLLVDATHAAGAVPVAAALADVVVCSCYKWLLGVHGVGIFYWNRARLPDLQPPFLGWHSAAAGPEKAAPTQFTLRADAARFEPGNPSFMNIYVLENALSRILEIGIPTIEEHVLELSSQVWQGVHDAGYGLMTPAAANERAGNICFQAPDIAGLTQALAQRGVLVWGGDGRIRVSTHLYNTEEDVAAFTGALAAL